MDDLLQSQCQGLVVLGVIVQLDLEVCLDCMFHLRCLCPVIGLGGEDLLKLNIKEFGRGNPWIYSCGTDMLLNEGTDLFPASNDVQLLVPIAVTATDDHLAQCL